MRLSDNELDDLREELLNYEVFDKPISKKYISCLRYLVNEQIYEWQLQDYERQIWEMQSGINALKAELDND